MVIKFSKNKFSALALLFIQIIFLYPQNNRTKKIDQNKLQLHWFNGEHLKITKRNLNKKDSNLQPALKKLLEEADTALTQGPFSVMDKKSVPPSGDKHDYTSLSPYWWPDTTKADSLPYIRRDGIVNPEREAYDKIPGYLMAKNSFTLALAYFYTEDTRYAKHAATLLKTWFIDDSTRMNPNFNYAQFVPGKHDGRSFGIIESRNFCKAMEAVILIQQSKYWNNNDTRAIKIWAQDFMDWLRNSTLGKEEARNENNHGSWYDFQVSYFALFTDNIKIAKSILERVPERRIETQIKSDGKQPHELERTRAYFYSTFNLEALYAVASLAEELEIDIWNYSSNGKPDLQKALDFLVSYIGREKEWPYQQIHGWHKAYENLFQLLRKSAIAYNKQKYEDLINKLPIKHKAESRINLLYPEPNLILNNN